MFNSVDHIFSDSTLLWIKPSCDSKISYIFLNSLHERFDFAFGWGQPFNQINFQFFCLLHQCTPQSQADLFYNIKQKQKQNKIFKMNLTTFWTPVIIVLLHLTQIRKICTFPPDYDFFDANNFVYSLCIP